MIPEAVFHEFPAKTLRKLTVSGRNPAGKCQEFDPGIGSGRNRTDPVTGSVQREYCFHEISGIPRNRSFPCRIVRPGHDKIYKIHYFFCCCIMNVKFYFYWLAMDFHLVKERLL